MYKWLRGLAAVGIAAVCSIGYLAISTYADPSFSPHYEIDESTVGGGGLIQSNSNSYQSTENIGDTAIGNSASANFQTNSGFVTSGFPALIFGITSPNAAFTDFSPTATATATAQFQVSDYTSYGYSVQIIGNPPSYQGHTITAMGTTGTAQTGVEQFGINLVANTSPTSFGANPDHGQFGVGSATANYGTTNNYRYVDGESIATAPKSSAVTTYTISYIINVTSLTPGGSYASNQQLICIGTY